MTLKRQHLQIGPNRSQVGGGATREHPSQVERRRIVALRSRFVGRSNRIDEYPNFGLRFPLRQVFQRLKADLIKNARTKQQLLIDHATAGEFQQLVVLDLAEQKTLRRHRW